MSREPESVASDPPARNAPWMGEFTAVDGESIYFLYVEQAILCHVSTFTRALFLWFSLFYIFNLEFAKSSRDLTLFFQEFIFGLPDNTCKKSSTYMSISTDIQGCTLH